MAVYIKLTEEGTIFLLEPMLHEGRKSRLFDSLLYSWCWAQNKAPSQHLLMEWAWTEAAESTETAWSPAPGGDRPGKTVIGPEFRKVGVRKRSLLAQRGGEDGPCDRGAGWGSGNEISLFAKSGVLPDLNKVGVGTREAQWLHLIVKYLNAEGSERTFSSQLRAAGSSLTNQGQCAVTALWSSSRPPHLSVPPGSTKARACLKITSSWAIKPHPIYKPQCVGGSY